MTFLHRQLAAEYQAKSEWHYQKHEAAKRIADMKEDNLGIAMTEIARSHRALATGYVNLANATRMAGKVLEAVFPDADAIARRAAFWSRKKDDNDNTRTE